MSRTLKLGILLLVALFSGMATRAMAQTAGSSPWWVEAQAGLSNASGEGSFFGMTSPALAVSAGYRFSRPLALRVGVGGYEGKGYVMRVS